MTQDLKRIIPTLKSGNEPLHNSGKPIGITLLDFWRWNTSDIVSNSTRGALAEFIVANALGMTPNNVRDEWQAYDLHTPEGITVEVKSAAFIQSWSQQEFSKIQFNVPKTRAWSSDTNLQEKVSKRQAQVYVFALLAHKEKSTIDPLDIDQWLFYVLPTKTLNERKRSQHSITLRSLEKLSKAVSYYELHDAVKLAAKESLPSE